MRINTGIFLKLREYFNNFSSIWNKNILLKIRAYSPKSSYKHVLENFLLSSPTLSKLRHSAQYYIRISCIPTIFVRVQL